MRLVGDGPKLYLGFGVPYFNTFFLKGTTMKKLSFFLPGYLKAQLHPKLEPPTQSRKD